MGRSFDETDPLTLAMRPPPGETVAEREARETAEAQARKISEAIDAEINKEKATLKKQKKPVKVLLLGQSESGKSTTLKNFQLTYAANAWAEERMSWRDVIRLNLVRSVATILDLLNAELNPPPANAPPTHAELALLDDAASVYSVEQPSLPFDDTHRALRERLAPLARVQAELETRLGAASHEPDAQELAAASNREVLAYDPAQGKEVESARTYHARTPTEFFVRATGPGGWKRSLDRLLPQLGQKQARGGDDELADVLAGCRGDIKTLWADELVREMLRRKKVNLQDGPGFFLEDIDRVTQPGYEPTDGDVVRARLRTVGVQEHRFVFEHAASPGFNLDVGRAAGSEWVLFDVGGHRSSRAAWYPYFDDVDAIIFLAPISAFDEKLAEDRRVNRLEDSYLLWKQISGSKLLSKTQIILFLNKIDVLERKLKQGVKIKEHVPSFGDRENEVPIVAKYFQHHFKEIARSCNPNRPFYVYLTSVVDTKATAATLAVVEEGILRGHLEKANLL